MLISDEGKFIFVHVQKTGGISIERILKRAYPDARFWYGRHGHAKDVIAEIGPDRWEEYFSFGMVRNPWDRLVSWYSMIQTHFRKLPRKKRRSAKPFDSPFWNHAVLDAHDFESFIRNCTSVIPEKGCLKSYAFNQYDYLSGADEDLAVDFVGRFESYASDVSVVLEQLRIQVDTVPWTNKSRHRHYPRYYNADTQRMVAERFRKDIDAFGYQF